MSDKKLVAPKVPVASHRIGDVKFPQDRYNIMYAVKKEIIRAAGRVRGSADKEAAFLATMEVLMAYAKAKIKYDTEVRAAVVDEAVAKLEAERAEAAETETVETDTAEEPVKETGSLEADLGLA